MEMEINRLLPSNYTLPECLGIGSFGRVYKCLKKDTNETVAVKIPNWDMSLNAELTILNKMTNLDERNVVRFIDSFKLTDKRTAVVFELLDMSLFDYLNKIKTVNVHDTRSVIQQLATALDALKTIGVIHADIKLDNIMVVDRNAQPLRVKLIDFGQSVLTSNVKQGKRYQVPSFRAPEIALGLPFSEAIDMWSLGVVMACMVLGEQLFLGRAEYIVMRAVVKLLGVPPAHLLRAGMYSRYNFVEMPSGCWRLKTIGEIQKISLLRDDGRRRSLDNLKTFPRNKLNEVEADEKECIDLLKAMLEMDADKRITPSEVLAHPFITREPCQHSTGTNETSATASASPPAVLSAQPPEPDSKLTASSEDVTRSSTTSGFAESIPATLYPNVIALRSPPAKQIPVERPPKCDLLKAMLEMDADKRITPSEVLAHPFITREPCQHSTGTNETSATASASPPAVLSAQPPEPDSKLTASSEDVTRFSATSGFAESIPATLYPNVIVLRSTPAKQIPVERPRKCDPPPMDRDMEQKHNEITSTTFHDMETKKKRKKNCFKSLFSWAKRTFCCCITVDDDEI